MKSIEDQINEILEEYAEEVDNTTEKELKKAAASNAKDLRNTSPKNSGDYARNWAYKKNESGGYTVYNKKYGWKTYLLENGHIIKNRRKGPSLGRVNGIKHIEPAAEKNINKLISDLKKEL